MLKLRRLLPAAAIVGGDRTRTTAVPRPARLVPRIRFHDLRHTHASLVASGVPIKIVTERLGHAHPALTMHTYQHLLPGISAEAANRFADLVGAASLAYLAPDETGPSVTKAVHYSGARSVGGGGQSLALAPTAEAVVQVEAALPLER